MPVSKLSSGQASPLERTHRAEHVAPGEQTGDTHAPKAPVHHASRLAVGGSQGLGHSKLGLPQPHGPRHKTRQRHKRQHAAHGPARPRGHHRSQRAGAVRHHAGKAASPASRHAAGKPTSPASAQAPVQVTSGAAGKGGPDPARLQAALQHDPYAQKNHQCYRFAWAAAKAAGGKGHDNAPSSTADRGKSLSSLNQLVAQGKIKPGDVIYVNKRPGTDPGSSNLANGPHWFTYTGNGKFVDQGKDGKSGVRTAAEMDKWVPGRKIDTIYHPYG